MANKLALSILISIILTIIIVSLMNVGTSLFLKEPESDRYCNYSKSIPVETYDNITKEVCEQYNGTWNPQPVQCIKAPCPQGYCDYYAKCSQAYSEALKPYNQHRFYIFAGIGFVLLLIGLFAIENLIQITGLASGGILVFEGIVMNLENKMAVFITLLGILVVFGILAWRVINRKDRKEKISKKVNKSSKLSYIMNVGGRFGAIMFFFSIFWDKFILNYRIDNFYIIFNFVIWMIAGILFGFWTWKKMQNK